MKRKLISILAALLVLIGTVPAFTTSASAAPRGSAFCKGAGSPGRLAALMQQSLDKDPSGNTPLDPEACHQARPATPHDFYLMFNLGGAKLASVKEVPGYTRSFVPVKVVGKYRSACLAYGGNGRWYPLPNCVTRYLHHEEEMWGDPVTHRPMLQGDCSNPTQGPEKPSGCADELVWVEKGDIVLMSGHGPTDTTLDACTGLLRPGESIPESPAVERCPHPGCDLDTANPYARYPEQWSGAFKAEQSGWAILRQPQVVAQEESGYQVFWCIHRAGAGDPWALGVQWFDYLPTGNPLVHEHDEYVATIQPDYEAALKAGRPTRVRGLQSVLWWDTDFLHFRQDDPTVVAPSP